MVTFFVESRAASIRDIVGRRRHGFCISRRERAQDREFLSTSLEIPAEEAIEHAS